MAGWILHVTLTDNCASMNHWNRADRQQALKVAHALTRRLKKYFTLYPFQYLIGS